MVKRLEPDPELDDLVRKLNENARATSEPAAGAEPDPDDDPEGGSARSIQHVAVAPARWRLPRRAAEGEEWLRRLLSIARKAGASDLLLVVGTPPMVRVNGRLEPATEQVLGDGSTGMLCAALVPAARRDAVQTDGSVDFAIRGPEMGRFRCNVHLERGHWSAAIRLLPDTPPELESLNLPPSLARFAQLEYGLVLVTGPTGCGKSTTLAALMRRILARRPVHLVTIEDPVEFEHEHAEGVVEHIEVGRDVPSYNVALRSVLRQDPDVLLIGEMRDAESMSIAITAAETGHLVFSTLHTANAPQTIYRVLDSYPANQQDAVRAQLASSLAGVVSQRLLPRADGEGRVPAVEILVATPAVRNLIRQGKIEQIRSQLTLEQQAGMQDFDHALASLVRSGLVSPDQARAWARNPTELEHLLRREAGN